MMAQWTTDELARAAAADELELATPRGSVETDVEFVDVDDAPANDWVAAATRPSTAAPVTATSPRW